MFRTRPLSRFFLRALCFLGWRSHLMFWASHAAHHMYASVPCYSLGPLTRFLYIDILRRQQVDPHYQFIPQLPSARLPDMVSPTPASSVSPL